jgi:UDPglucose 6-dehydrogenase
VGDKIIYAEGQYEALEQADALIIATEWSEFRTPDFNRIKSLMKKPGIFDGRNLFQLYQMEECGFHYESVGRRVVN